MNTCKRKTIIKYILCILFIFYLGNSLFAADENLKWYETKEEALSAAKQQNKFVLLLLGNDDCSYCLIAKNHLKKPALTEIVDENYILWYCDFEKSDEGNEYDAMYPSAYIPLLCIIDPNTPESPLSYARGAISEINLKTLLENNRPTGNEKISATTTQAYIFDNILTLSNMLTNEIVSIYTLNGQLIDVFSKKENNFTKILPSLPKGLLLISSSEKWAVKILNK